MIKQKATDRYREVASIITDCKASIAMNLCRWDEQEKDDYFVSNSQYLFPQAYNRSMSHVENSDSHLRLIVYTIRLSLSKRAADGLNSQAAINKITLSLRCQRVRALIS